MIDNPAPRPQAYRAVYQIARPTPVALLVHHEDPMTLEKTTTRHEDKDLLNQAVLDLLAELDFEAELEHSDQPKTVWCHDNDELHAEFRAALGTGYRWGVPDIMIETPSEQGVQRHNDRRRRFEAIVESHGLIIRNVECQTVHSSNVCHPVLREPPARVPEYEEAIAQEAATNE